MEAGVRESLEVVCNLPGVPALTPGWAVSRTTRSVVTLIRVGDLDTGGTGGGRGYRQLVKTVENLSLEGTTVALKVTGKATITTTC